MTDQANFTEAATTSRPESNLPRSLAIRTCFAHHAADSGYRQILRHTKPIMEIGLDERAAVPDPFLFRKYQWLYELKAWRACSRLDVDVVHILYGENYFRFLDRLLPAMPLVLTFHQPADHLATELQRGDGMGRVAALAHRLNRGRFSRIAAAIITAESQRDAVCTVVDPTRVHCIPLGVSVERLIAKYDELAHVTRKKDILTVGNWRRDWVSYFAVARHCAVHHPGLRFTLVNRTLPERWRTEAAGCPNVRYVPGLSDDDLYREYKAAAVHYLPLEAAAGNNAVNESLAFGCPIVSNVPLDFAGASPFFAYCSDDPAATAREILRFVESSDAEREAVTREARIAVAQRDWMGVAERTIDIYRNVIEADRRRARSHAPGIPV